MMPNTSLKPTRYTGGVALCWVAMIHHGSVSFVLALMSESRP
jgi:hypothetical protein